MEKRTISVELRANINDFKQQMRSASTSLEDAVKRMDKSGKVAETRMGRWTQRAQYQSEAMSRAGTALLGVGAATLAGAGLSVRAAMKWESAWTGVTKTVDGTATQMGRLEGELRGLATTLPVSHEEIASVAEAAGQLGVKVNDVAAFTKTMIDLGQTTNLSADQAATSIARIYNIMGQKNSEAYRFGNVLVALGNNFATTESEITEFTLRMAASGRQAGLTTADVAAYGAALSSVGVEAEAGGTAMSKVFTDVADAVRSGQGSLETYSKLAGVSAEEFRKMFSQDSATAIAKVVGGFGDLSKAGKDTSSIFKELKLNDSRLKRSILSMGQAVDTTLLPALKQANKEWKNGSALVEEANKRYNTDEAKMSRAFNKIKDAAIDMGAGLAPIVAKVTDGIGSMVHWFTALSGPVQTTAVAFAGLLGTGALVTGTFLKLLPQITATITALEDLGWISGVTSSKLGKMFGKLGKLGLKAGAFAAVVGAAGVSTLSYFNGEQKFVDDKEVANKVLTQKKSDPKDFFKGLTYSARLPVGLGWKNFNAADKLPAVFDKITNSSYGLKAGSKIYDALDFFGEGSDITKFSKQFDEIGNALAALSADHLPKAQEMFKRLRDETGAQGKEQAKLLDLMPRYKETLIEQASQAGITADSENLLKLATGELTIQTDTLTGKTTALSASQEDADRAAKKMYDRFGQLVPTTKEAVEAAEKYEQSLRNLSDIDVSKKADKGLQAWLKSLKEQREAVEKWQDNMLTLAATGLSKTALDRIAQMGPQVGGKLVQELVNAANDKSEYAKIKQTLESTIGEAAAAAGGEFAETFAAFANSSDGQKVLQAAFDKMGEDGAREVRKKFEEGMSAWQINDALQLGLHLDSKPADQELEALKQRVLTTDAVVTINGEALPAREALNSVLNAIAQGKEAVTINGKTTPVETALATIIQKIYESDPTMTVQAATQLAKDMVASLKTYASKDTAFYVNANQGQDNVTSWKRRLSGGINFTANAWIKVRGNSISQITDGLPSYSVGGAVTGPGTATSDSVPAWLSNGEHVLTAHEVQRAGGHQAIERLRRMIRTGQRLATGGVVGTITRHITPPSTPQALNVYVTNPFTGEQVRAHARAVAVDQIIEAGRYS